MGEACLSPRAPFREEAWNPNPGPDLPEKRPAVLLESLVLKTLWGLFCCSRAWLMEMRALVPCLPKFVPQKFTCGEFPGSPVVKTPCFHC